MPCYEVSLMCVEFKVAHRDLLEAALKALGLRIVDEDEDIAGHWLRLNNGLVLELREGRATIQAGQQDLLNQLKREYSRQVIRRVAQKNRWTVSKTSETEGVFIKA